MNHETDTVPAILALKRFIRRVVRQIGLSVVSLMLVIGVATHSATADEPASVALNAKYDLVVEASVKDTSSTNAKGLQPADLLPSVTTSTAATQQLQASVRPTRMLRSSVLHHHLTGARLSTAAIARPSSTEVANAK